MKFADLIEILGQVNTMEEIRFWALYVPGAIAAIGWAVARVIEAVKK